MAMAEPSAGQPVGYAGIRGGLCLVMGAKNTALATQLAGASELYVQVLQPDAKLAADWGRLFGSLQNASREKLGVRNAAFDPEHYGSNLFNLIVVEDITTIGNAKLTDVCRLLAPNGVVAFKASPDGFDAQAKELGMTARSVDGFAVAYQKPVKPVEWKVCDSIKWRAGPRAANASTFTGIAVGGGKLFYRERMEVAGEWPQSRSQLVARDAYNGRVLWTAEEAVGWDPGWSSGRQRQYGMAADSKGRLFTATADGKFVCLDADTGKPRFELIASGVKGTGGGAIGPVQIYKDSVVLAGGCAFSADDGKLLWKYGGWSYVLAGDRMFVRTGRNGEEVEARRLPDGQVLWKCPCPPGRDSGVSLLCSDKHLHLTQTRPKPKVITVDIETGKEAWTYEPDTTGRSGFGFYLAAGKLFVTYATKPATGDFSLIRLATDSGKVEQEGYGAPGKMWAGGCWDIQAVGDYLLYHHNIWLNLRTLERTFPYLAHPACFTGAIPGYGMMYNFPSRKGGPLQGVTAIAPADFAFDHEPGGKIHRKFTDTQPGEPTRNGDWPMFRGNPARGNAANADLGEKLAKDWTVAVGLGGKPFGVMNGERTGLTQPVSAYGLVVVSDIDGQRIVALNTTDGKEKWTFHVGSRVDFSPTLYNGLCLFTAKDGWVYCLNARDGTAAWKLLITSRERYIGGQEKLESQWPVASDVLVADGVGYASAGIGSSLLGGIRAVAFKPQTGELVWSQCYHGELNPIQERQLASGLFVWGGGKSPVLMAGQSIDPATGKMPGGTQAATPVLKGHAMDDYLAFGNSLPRTGEDRAGDSLSDGRVSGRIIAFSADLAVAHTRSWGAESWDARSNRGVPTKLNLVAATQPKMPLWQSEETEFVADDIVLTPKLVYCVGHYQRVKKDPELWVVSPKDGKVLATVPVDGFPAFNGMSVAGDRLFIATREGRLICYRREK